MNLLSLLAVTPLGILAFFSLMRCLFQLSRVDFYNGVVQFVCRFTDFYCTPLRAILPRVARLDIASLLMAYVLEGLAFFLFFNLQTGAILPIDQMLVWALLAVLGLTLRLYFIALILVVIFSWIRPQGSTALADLSQQLIAPLLAPIQRIIPAVGGLDFSPILLFLLIYMLRTVWRNAAFTVGMPLAMAFGA